MNESAYCAELGAQSLRRLCGYRSRRRWIDAYREIYSALKLKNSLIEYCQDIGGETKVNLSETLSSKARSNNRRRFGGSRQSHPDRCQGLPLSSAPVPNE